MNKKQLIARVQRLMGPGATRRTAGASVEAVLSALRTATASGEKLHVAGFGTFEQAERPARRGYDINSGSTRDLPAKRVLTFRPARGFPA